jgi:hypothetical protein
MEEKLADLPKESGLLFVSVRPEPSENGFSTKYTVRVGMARRFEVGTAHALVARTLADEVSVGAEVLVEVYRGVLGACRDDSFGTARPLQD